MTSRLRRAGGFAAVGTLALAAPALGAAAAAPFAAVALAAAFLIDEGPLFDLFARPGDRRDARLNGLAGFSLAAAGLAVLTAYPRTQMPVSAFVGAVLVIAYGNLGTQLVRETTGEEFATVGGFLAGGTLAGAAGQAAVASLSGAPIRPAEIGFLTAVGALVAALLRSVLFERDDPLTMLSVGLALWFFASLPLAVSPVEVAVALAVMSVLGYLSYAISAASVPGMLTGVLLGVLTIVLGGYGWFAVLIAFFVIGALATKFRYDNKLDRGVAEENEGARGSGNVLGNAAVALLAVVGYAASARFAVGDAPFLFAFAGSVAAAMSDTLSSEFGGLFDDPRLITTLEPVDPGTDGGVTWQGEVAGVAGAALIAGIAALLLPLPDFALGASVIALGGVSGMTVDSLLGATVEGDRLGNQAVNFLATLSGAAVSTALAVLAL